MVTGSKIVHDRCIRQLAQNVKKSVKYLSNPAETVRYTAGIVFPSKKEKAVKA
jgi:hypothetical protein